jgi:uncharacterized membrane protein
VGHARTSADERTEVRIGNLLRAGVILSATVAFVGGVVYLSRHGREVPDYRLFRGEPSDLRSVGGILGGTFTLRGRDLIQLGFLLLIATPVARVAVSVFGFLRERDWLYVVVTLFVLALLLYSLFVSRA